jgi:uncharacterized protein YjiS (DUF1127 family)
MSFRRLHQLFLSFVQSTPHVATAGGDLHGHCEGIAQALRAVDSQNRAPTEVEWHQLEQSVNELATKSAEARKQTNEPESFGVDYLSKTAKQREDEDRAKAEARNPEPSAA